MSVGALGGMRIIEASAFVAAPLGGMTLAQLGAEVIRIDLPGGGLDFHRWPVNENDTSLFWCGLNKGKQSVCIDFTKPAGRELAMALITAPGKDAGMLLTNFPPRGWLSYESLRVNRPDLIQLTIQGDRHGNSAVDYTVNPTVGLPYLTGPQSTQGAVNHVLPAWDLVTGQMAATGLLAADRHRQRSGAGQHIKLALEDVALAMMGNLGFIAEAQIGNSRERIGNYLFGAYGADFTCSGGERVMVVALTLKQWNALREALDLAHDLDALQAQLKLDLSVEGNRYRAREAISDLVRPRIGRLPFADITKRFTTAGVCWSRYQTMAELVERDVSCSAANPLFRTLEQHGVGPILTPTTPLDFPGRLPPLPAPQLGADTVDILQSILHLSDGEIGGFVSQGVIESP